MSETPTDVTRPTTRSPTISDVWFLLAIGFVVVALAVTIAVHH